MTEQATVNAGAGPGAPEQAATTSPEASEPSPTSSGWRRPPLTQSQLRMDIGIAVFLFLDSLLVMALSRVAQVFSEPASPTVSVLLLAGCTLPLAWRRRYPIAALIAVATAFVIAGEMAVPETVVINIALFMALYSVGAWEGNRSRAALVRGGVVAAMFIWLLISFFRVAMDPPEGETVTIGPGTLSPMAAWMLVQVLTNVLYFAGAVWFGNHAWSAAQDRAMVAERARQLQAERGLVEAQAVTIERIRLARELHDAVAHHVSLIGVQAGASRALLSNDPQQAAQSLEKVEDSAREAITELHGLLSTLREDSNTETEPVGSLGVERIGDLIEDVRAAGLQVAYQVVGEPVTLRPLLSLNIYRITQEALTNVRKHAGQGARADVRLRYLDGAVELEVADDGGGRRRPIAKTHSGGLGQVGMQERVSADGGSLHTGPLREGGYLVRAQIPLATPTGDDPASPTTSGEQQ
ncbi:MAG TPA: sensor histidine kinase [Beutenbergiaceae bacterium]|nr:sensor histidine kinase [Beutenbergiaceae bacterium]